MTIDRPLTKMKIQKKLFMLKLATYVFSCINPEALPSCLFGITQYPSNPLKLEWFWHLM